MKTATIRGVPLALQRDGWWMDPFENRKKPDWDARPSDMRLQLLLLALVALADSLIWQVLPGVSLAVFVLALVGAAAFMARDLSPRRVMMAGAMAVVAVAPVVELVQPLSLLLLVVGCVASLCLIAGVDATDIGRAIRRYPGAASVLIWQKAGSLARVGTPTVNLRAAVLGWAVPLGLGAVFALLLVGANPVIDGLWSRRRAFPLPEIHLARIWFWLASGLVVCLALVAHRLYAPLTHRPPQRHTVRRKGLINAASVTRSLVLFNALFTVQTIMDVAFLYGSVSLPEGMSYATYAHRGAYPLLVTALLAGGFAVLARPFADDRPLLRGLMLLWLLQTLALVVASFTRLEIYVDAYGLTRLRVAAAIWMGVVGLGLGLVIWQMMCRYSTGWMLTRCTLVGLGALYGAAFLNVDALVAQYNLTRDVQLDVTYLCGLGEGAIGPIQQHTGQHPASWCGMRFSHPELHGPADWREWGFRNWRLRSSLASLQTENAP